MPPGVAGPSLMLPMRVLAAAPAGGGCRPVGVGAMADIDAGMKVAVDLGAQVHQHELRHPQRDVDPEARRGRTRRWSRYARRHGCVLVAAAGNTGQPSASTPRRSRA